jgi:hypothetical protein
MPLSASKTTHGNTAVSNLLGLRKIHRQNGFILTTLRVFWNISVKSPNKFGFSHVFLYFCHQEELLGYEMALAQDM